ncbi:hypothetical protein [Actinoplanes flavus]|uniref:DUF234 domain-containing protein n=1 Tax=Actinoplanes flavus TaxID=2820290 RepID=A0ABS3UQR0_9ACTN|nr:hypothetical protein [Actinoplanes flavus]MBO3741109.1 hypothetical protein [Actinoplanes flavus]
MRPYLPEIERLRGDITLERVRTGWASWRGRAVEPLLRESLARLLPAGLLPSVPVVGAYGTRSNSVGIDVVGADREPLAREPHFLGSVKWLERSAFDEDDLLALQRHRAAVTDEPVPLLAISRGGVTAAGLHAAFGPEELLTAWRR